MELSRTPPPRLGIRVTRRDQGLLIEVWDSDATPPLQMDKHLAVVETVSLEWNFYHPHGGGKVIWAELGPLPQRVAGGFSFPDPDELVELTSILPKVDVVAVSGWLPDMSRAVSGLAVA
jgi:hypothetical protein